jgi:hypothetical protein
MDEFSELRICLEELLKKIEELQTAFNNISKAKQNETKKVAEGVRKYDKETNDDVKKLTLDESGLQESKGGFNMGKTNESRFCNGVTLYIMEHIAKSLKIHVYLLAVLILVFVISKIYAC